MTLVSPPDRADRADRPTAPGIGSGHGRELAVAGIWGFLEATLFFIVPDVWLTQIALKNLRRALLAALLAASCAVIGGAVMLTWGRLDIESAETVLERVPAISKAQVEWVRQELTTKGPPAVFLGPIYRTPYKIYAAETGALGLSSPVFLALSLWARLLRFVLLASIAALLSRTLLRRLSLRIQQALVWIGWASYYLWHFAEAAG